MMKVEQINMFSINKYKEWDLLEVLPDGWKMDSSCGSPLFGYDFCTDGRSILNGGKRALVRSIRKGIPRVKFIERTLIFKKENEKKQDENYVFPSKTVNDLARKKFQEQLLKEIGFDLMVCEIENWNKLEYLNELKTLINELGIKIKEV